MELEDPEGQEAGDTAVGQAPATDPQSPTLSGVQSGKKSTRLPPLEEVPVQPRVHVDPMLPGLLHYDVQQYRTGGKETVDAKLVGCSEGQRAMVEQFGTMAGMEEGVFQATHVVVTGGHSDHLLRPQFAANIANAVRAAGLEPDQARLSLAVGNRQGYIRGRDGHIDVIVPLTQSAWFGGDGCTGAQRVYPFMQRVLHKDHVRVSKEGSDTHEERVYWVQGLRASSSLQVIPALCTDCAVFRGVVQNRSAGWQFRNWTAVHMVLLQHGINPDHVLVYVTSDLCISVDPRTGRRETSFEVIVRVKWLTAMPRNLIKIGAWNLLKGKRQASFAAGGLSLIGYPSLEALAAGRPYALSCLHVPLVTEVCGLMDGISGATIMRLLALDAENHEALQSVRAVVVVRGSRSTRSTAYLFWADLPDPSLNWRDVWEASPLMYLREEPLEALRMLRHVIMRSKLQSYLKDDDHLRMGKRMKPIAVNPRVPEPMENDQPPSWVAAAKRGAQATTTSAAPHTHPVGQAPARSQLSQQIPQRVGQPVSQQRGDHVSPVSAPVPDFSATLVTQIAAAVQTAIMEQLQKQLEGLMVLQAQLVEQQQDLMMRTAALEQAREGEATDERKRVKTSHKNPRGVELEQEQKDSML